MSGCGSLSKPPDASKHEKQEPGHTVRKRVFFLGCWLHAWKFNQQLKPVQTIAIPTARQIPQKPASWKSCTPETCPAHDCNQSPSISPSPLGRHRCKPARISQPGSHPVRDLLGLSPHLSQSPLHPQQVCPPECLLYPRPLHLANYMLRPWCFSPPPGSLPSTLGGP